MSTAGGSPAVVAEKAAADTAAARTFIFGILDTAKAALGVKPEEVLAPGLRHDVLEVRRWVAREAVAKGFPAAAIGRAMNLHHTSVLRLAGDDARAAGIHARMAEQAARAAQRANSSDGREAQARAALQKALALGPDTREAFDAAREATREFPGLWREFCRYAYPYSWKAQAATPPGGA